MITQLNPSIPVYVVSKNKKGRAIFLIDYGPEDHVLWGIAMDDSGEIWWESNPNVRFQTNYSLGRTYGF